VALPTAYFTSTRNAGPILTAIQGAQAPPRFTQKFLEGLGFASNPDRLFINVLKALGFLSDTGEPLQRYHEFLDPAQAKRVLADGVRHAYSDLFQINVNANSMNRSEVKNKMKTLSQGQYSDSVLDKMASTFKALADQADFTAVRKPATETNPEEDELQTLPPDSTPRDSAQLLSGLVYNINLHLPESRDPAVYDALFRSLKEHLFK
jgi:hypothetical protein